MKRFIFWTLFILLVNTALAQWSNDFLNSKSSRFQVYATGNRLIGNSDGNELGICFVMNSKFSINVGFSATKSDFDQSIDDFLKSADIGTTANLVYPDKLTENYHLMLGWLFDLNSKSGIRITAQGGPGIAINKEPGNFRITGKTPVLGYDYQQSPGISWLLQTNLELPLNDMLGINAGPRVMVSQNNEFYGLGVGIIYGLLSR